MASAFIFPFFFSGLAVAGLPSSSELSDLDKLQGKWAVVEAKSKDPVDQLLPKGLIYEFKGKVLINSKDELELSRFTVEINPKTKPRKLELIQKNGKRRMKCIYDLAGNALKIRYPCFPALERPKSFDPNVNPAQVLLILKRVE
jgi:uncharacterized protein (TIGR03067 family)